MYGSINQDTHELVGAPQYKRWSTAYFLLQSSLIPLNFFVNNKGKDERIDWFIYLTHWQLVLNSLSAFSQSYQSYQLAQEVGAQESSRSKCCFPLKNDKCSDIDYSNVTMTISAVVTIAFWAVIAPMYYMSKPSGSTNGTNITPSHNGTNPHEPVEISILKALMPHGLPLFLHVCNRRQIQHPYDFKWVDSYTTMILLAIYLVFTLVYYFAGGTDPGGYSYIYAPLDWSDPMKAIAIGFGGVLATPCIYGGLSMLLSCFSGPNKSPTQQFHSLINPFKLCFFSSDQADESTPLLKGVDHSYHDTAL